MTFHLNERTSALPGKLAFVSQSGGLTTAVLDWAKSRGIGFSHFISLAGADDVYDAALRRAGMLRVDTIQELFDAVETLARAHPVNGNRLAIMTNGGGPGVMAADAVALHGGQLAGLSAAAMQRLDGALPAMWSHGNPVDIIGDAPVSRYVSTLEALLEDNASDAILFIHVPTAIVPAADIARACAPLAKGKHVLSCWLGADAVAEARSIFDTEGIPCYDTPEQAVSAFLQLVAYQRNQQMLMQTPSSVPRDFAPDATAARNVVSEALKAGREWLNETQTRAVLTAYGIPVVRTRGAASTDEAIQAATAMGFPVALKIRSPQITHKSDVRGVALNLANADEVLHAAEAMVQRLREHAPQAQLTGFTVQEMVVKPKAHEIIAEIDINPLLVDDSGVIALDARIRAVKSTSAGADRLAIRPYPSELEERVMINGRDVMLRPIRPEDEPQHAQLLQRVDAADIQLRFFYAVRVMSHNQLARFTQIDYDREMAFIASVNDGQATVETWGVVQAIADPDNANAEFAILVRSDIKGQGLGSLLMKKIIRYCAERGTSVLTGSVLRGNERMLSLARELGFSMTHDNDLGVVQLSLSLANAAHAS